jgi:hypothetical protein
MSSKPKSSKPRGQGFKLRPLPEESTPEVTVETPPAFDDLGELPHGYGEDVIFLIAQEPHWLFTYWDIDIARHPGGAACLRYYRGGGDLEGEVEVPFETRNWYLPVQNAAAEYYVEIGFYRGKSWNLIARSITVHTPPEGLSPSEDFDYATVPFHLSFQRLIDRMKSALESGEDLITAMSRLQQKGDFAAFGSGPFPDLLSEDQRSLLAAMLGPDLLSELASANLSSAALEARIRVYLEEKLSSGGASGEFLSSFRESAAGLFSAGAWSSESALMSWSIAALSSWAAGALSSWTASGSEVVSSWLGSAAASSSFSSWNFAQAAGIGGVTSWSSWAAALGGSWAQVALGSWSQAALSSWAQSSLSSWGAAASWSQAGVTSWSVETSAALAGMSSWLQAVQSSWAQAALSSWSTAEVSSWFSAAAVTSWSGASETLSSFGARGFFMHVNAEVIFYGGTDPRAKVTIDGHPVALNPDGTFRYHFIFPNSDYEIPIIATSPDGVEMRSATLRFERSTGKVGLVTDTPQPPIGEPMGRK